MLNTRGGILGDFTVTRLGDETFYVVGPTSGELYHADWFRRHLPASGVTLSQVGTRYGVLHLAGPKSRALLEEATDTSLRDEEFKFLHACHLDFGICRALVIRVSFSGALGYEVHVPTEYHRTLYLRLRDLGRRRYGLQLMGSRALNSLRLERGYRLFGSDINTEVTPLEAGLEAFVRFDKTERFIGREALIRQRENGIAYRLMTLVVESTDVDALGGEPLWADGRIIGSSTSGGYGFTVERSLAIGWIDVKYASPGTTIAIDILGTRYPAHVVEDPAYRATPTTP